jgi:hypothetical protein
LQIGEIAPEDDAALVLRHRQPQQQIALPAAARAAETDHSGG